LDDLGAIDCTRAAPGPSEVRQGSENREAEPVADLFGIPDPRVHALEQDGQPDAEAHAAEEREQKELDAWVARRELRHAREIEHAHVRDRRLGRQARALVAPAQLVVESCRTLYRACEACLVDRARRNRTQVTR